MKFVADSMLGKLCRWLRMIGQDVKYSAQFTDSELLMLAKVEVRVLLTRDFELYKRAITRSITSFYLEGKTEPEWLAEIGERYNLALDVDMDKSHCPICNTKLVAVTKEQLYSVIEKNTYTYYENFWRCSNCSQIYWKGAHWKHINNILNQAQLKLEKQNYKNGG